jgi:transposase-like protein
MITSALQLYFTGESFRNIQKFLRLQGVKMSHVAIYKWVKKYVGLMQVYLEKITPNGEQMNYILKSGAIQNTCMH